jgi:ketosteroid isomerase-like protein
MKEALEANRRFFVALTRRDLKALNEILSDNFILIDVLTGSEVAKHDLIAALESSQLVFESVDPSAPNIRCFGSTAVITGRTEMAGHYGSASFRVQSRYTHVFSKEHIEWLLVSAQGTRIAE